MSYTSHDLSCVMLLGAAILLHFHHFCCGGAAWAVAIPLGFETQSVITFSLQLCGDALLRSIKKSITCMFTLLRWGHV